MPTKSVNLVFTQEQFDQLKQARTNIDTQMGFALNISKDERIRIRHLPLRLIRFIMWCVMHAERDPSLLPSFVDLQEIKDLMFVAEVMENFQTWSIGLTEKIRDTKILAYREAYKLCYPIKEKIRSMAKSRVPGLDAMLAEIATFFPHSPPQKKSEQDNQDNQNTTTQPTS